MKKIIYAIIALLTMAISSCSNEDIEIKTVGKLYNLTYNINTQNVYDEFKLTDNIREILREQSWALGVTSLIYDKEGNLVDKKFSHQFNFNNIKEEFEGLTEGAYTVISIETLVNPDYGYDANDWSIKGEEKISTLEIYQASYEVYYPFVLGVCTNNVTITKDQSLNAMPKAIGSLFNFYWIGFDKSTHIEVGFATNDILDTYKLDPALSRMDRYCTNLTSVGYINIRAERDVKGQNLISAARYMLEESIDWVFCFKKAENNGTPTWTNYHSNTGKMSLEDGKIYYAGMCYVDESTVCKTYIGDESGFMTWYQSLNKTENNSLVPDLCMTWGSSVNNVQSAMKDYTLTLGTSGKAVQMEDGSYEINYAGKGKESKISYSFTSATTGLFETDIQYSKSSVSSSELLEYLNSKYVYLADESGTYMYCTNDYTTFVLFFEINGVWNLGFVDANYISNMDTKLNGSVYKKMKSFNNISNTKIQESSIQTDTHTQKSSAVFKKTSMNIQFK